jgi:hypothetical protein
MVMKPLQRNDFWKSVALFSLEFFSMSANGGKADMG